MTRGTNGRGLSKLGLRDRVQIVIFACETGLNQLADDMGDEVAERA